MTPVRMLTVVMISLLAFAAPAFAVQFTGEVTGVPRGDTLLVQHEGRVRTIRLHGLLAPVQGNPTRSRPQPFWPKRSWGKRSM